MESALFTQEGMAFLARFGHFLAGITWIGILYYFNFIQGSYFKEADGGAKSDATQKLVPRALWWFRWGAMGTWLTGVYLLWAKGHMAGTDIYTTSWGITILVGGLLGTIMFLNVWLIIWPAQKVVIASAKAVAGGGEADPNVACCAARAGLASRTNTLFSIPLLFFMAMASHLSLSVSGDSLCTMWIVVGVLTTAIEANVFFGKTGPMTSVRGVIISGFVLTAIYYCILECLS